MLVSQVMTRNPMCCTPDTPLENVAKLMLDRDCGEIPVIDDDATRRPVGVVTDRDIVCRVLAYGRSPVALPVAQCMTTPVVVATEGASLEDCCRAMEEYQIRRVPVIDGNGALSGIVSQADIARAAPGDETGEVVRRVSEPNATSSSLYT